MKYDSYKLPGPLIPEMFKFMYEYIEIKYMYEYLEIKYMYEYTEKIYVWSEWKRSGWTLLCME